MAKKENYYALLLSELIKCKTIYSPKYMDEFEKLRFKLKEIFPEIYEKAEFKVFGDGALLYKIKGYNQNKSILLMSHHDVVEANGIWEYEPFSGELRNNKLCGRGTVDTKTSFFAELMAMEELLKSNFTPDVNVYIASSNNEEVGGNGIVLIKKYLEEENINFELILDEGGAIIDPPLPGISEKCAMIAVHEKGRTVLNCIAKEKSGHTSFKSEDSTVVRISKFVNEVSSTTCFEQKLHKEVRAMFKDLSSYMRYKEKLVFSNINIFFPIIKRILPRISKEGAQMLGTTCAFTSIRGGDLNDKIAEETIVIAFLRAITDEDLEKDIDKLKQIAKKYEIKIEIKSNEMPKAADLNHKNYFYVKDKIKETFGNIPVAPYILPAGTDARHLTDMCPCTLRFAPIILSKEQFKSVHNINENIDIDVIGKAVEFYKNIISGYKDN
ncbi:MAG: M20/M25/M40 family metallo-hydrolase [Sarcina sp.]